MAGRFSNIGEAQRIRQKVIRDLNKKKSKAEKKSKTVGRTKR